MGGSWPRAAAMGRRTSGTSERASSRRSARATRRNAVAYVAFNQRGDLLAAAASGGTTALGSLEREGAAPHRRAWPATSAAMTAGWGWESSAPRSAAGRSPQAGSIARCTAIAQAVRINSLDITPDGRLLASAASDGVRLWDLAAGKEVAALPTGSADSVIFDTRRAFPDHQRRPPACTAGPSGRTGPMSARFQLGPARAHPCPAAVVRPLFMPR